MVVCEVIVVVVMVVWLFVVIIDNTRIICDDLFVLVMYRVYIII